MSSRAAIVLFSALAFYSCAPKKLRPEEQLPLKVPERFSQSYLEFERDHVHAPWWMEFNKKELNALVERALHGNFSLKSAWQRLNRAKALAGVAASQKFPSLTLRTGANRERSKNRTFVNATGLNQSEEASYSSNYYLNSSLSYEVDLWRKISATAKSSDYRARAVRKDLEGTALLLVANISRLYFEIIEQRSLIELLNRQVDTSKKLLDLTELRFSLGRGSAADIYQQRSQLAAVASQVPLARSRLRVNLLQLASLLGSGTTSEELISVSETLPVLPAISGLDRPIDLLYKRPDLQARRLRLEAANFDVAASFAERFPQLLLNFSYDFRAQDLADLFSRQLATIAGEILLPLVDGGRRRAEQRASKASYLEQLNAFAQEFLS